MKVWISILWMLGKAGRKSRLRSPFDPILRLLLTFVLIGIFDTSNSVEFLVFTKRCTCI